jgi:hypothetical protein
VPPANKSPILLAENNPFLAIDLYSFFSE